MKNIDHFFAFKNKDGTEYFDIICKLDDNHWEISIIFNNGNKLTNNVTTDFILKKVENGEWIFDLANTLKKIKNIVRHK